MISTCRKTRGYRRTYVTSIVPWHPSPSRRSTHILSALANTSLAWQGKAGNEVASQVQMFGNSERSSLSEQQVRDVEMEDAKRRLSDPNRVLQQAQVVENESTTALRQEQDRWGDLNIRLEDSTERWAHDKRLGNVRFVFHAGFCSCASRRPLAHFDRSMRTMSELSRARSKMICSSSAVTSNVRMAPLLVSFVSGLLFIVARSSSQKSCQVKSPCI
jgi:hypothetical protein